MSIVDGVGAGLGIQRLLIERADCAVRLASRALGSHGRRTTRAGRARVRRRVLLVHAVLKPAHAVYLSLSRQEGDADLLLLNAGLGSALDIGPDLRDIGGFGELGGGHGDGLHEELVPAAGVHGWVFFHGLQEDLDFDAAGGLDAAGVWAHTVSVGGLVSADRRGGEEVIAYCFGAVVLTLKATGSLLGLCRRRTWETSWVKGPGR